MLFNLLQAAVDTTALTQAMEPAVQEKTMSLIDMAQAGGWLMLVLLLLSIMAIYIFGSKWWMIRKASQLDKNFMKDIRDLIHDGKIKTATDLCQKYDSPIARLVEKGIERMGRPLQDISGGAPMIGFLGTVTGMIQAFFRMSTAGNNIDITLLSGGIYEAMVTTVGGLFVGIIAYFGYNYLSSQISNLVFKMESTTIEFIDMLHEPAGE